MIFSHAAECSVKSTFSVTAECWCSSLEEQRRLPVDVKPRSRKLECPFRWKRAVSLRTIDEPDRKINTAALLASNQCVLALLKNWLKPYFAHMFSLRPRHNHPMPLRYSFKPES